MDQKAKRAHMQQEGDIESPEARLKNIIDDGTETPQVDNFIIRLKKMAFYNNIGGAIDVLEKLSSDVGNVFLGQGREKKIMFNFLRNVAKDKNGEFLKDFLNPEDDLLRNGFVGLLGACKKHDAALILIWLPTQLICFLKISMFLESF